MEQPILINRNSNNVSNQEMQTMAARGFAEKAMKEARSQVVRDYEDMRENAKRISDHRGMKTLFNKLLEVAKSGANNIKKHMTDDKKLIMVQEAAQQIDIHFHKEMGQRFVDGSEPVTSLSAQNIAKIIMAAIHTQKDIAVEMGITMTKFVSVMVAGMIDANMANWEMIKLWWTLQDEFDNAKNRGLTMYDTNVQKKPLITPEIAREYREELEKIIIEMQMDYAACFSDMGLKLFANSMMTTCVTSAGTCLALTAAGVFVGVGAVADTNVIRTEAVEYLMRMGRISGHVAVFAAGLCLLIVGYNYFFGKTSQPEKHVERWQRFK